jgi:hypothetical protein
MFHRECSVDGLDENDPRIAHDFMLDFNKIEDAVKRSKAPIMVMKPILNSFDADYLLQTFSDSKILWIVREYQDMIASSMRQFATKVSDFIKEFVLHGKGNNWLSCGIPLETREMISHLDTSHFTPEDWMALVWWSVNRTVILNRLYERNRFCLMKYEDLVNNPETIMRHVYKFIGLQYKKRTTKYIHTAAIGKGADIMLCPEVERLCQELSETLIDLTCMK